MPVNPEEIAAMQRFRAILLGGGEVNESQITGLPTPSIKEHANAPLGSQVDAKDDMKAILAMFNTPSKAVTEQVERIRESAIDDRQMRDALITQKTPTGVKMGSWEIKVHEDRGVKTYDVSNVHSGEAIAQDLTLYESAIALTKLLNFHVGINSAQVRNLLDLEDRYARTRQDAVTFRLRMKQRTEAKDHVRAAIAEDRYQETRQAALALREDIIALSRRL